MTVATRPATYREVFAEPSFRTLFAARTFAISATSLQIFALSVLVYTTTESPLLSAVAFGAGFLPQFAGGLLLGSLTDRLRSRPLIVTGYAVEAALSAVLALAGLPVGVALALVAAVACFAPVFNGAAAKVIAEHLTGDAYVLGRAVSSMSSSFAQLLGLAGGGVAVAALGASHALLLAAAFFLVAATIVQTFLTTPPGSLAAPPAPPGTSAPPSGTSPSPASAATRTDQGRRNAIRDSWTGATAMLADRTIRRLLLAQWLPPALVVGAEALLIPYSANRGLPPGAGALLMAGPAAGMLIGDLVIGRFVPPTWRERLVFPLVLLLGAPLLLLPAAPPLPVTAALLVLSGFGSAYSLGLQRAFLEAAPEHRVGQLFALLSTGLMALQGVGPLLSGAVAELATPAVAIACAGAATTLVAVTTRKPR
ncbi:MFS transporter [Actinoplanes philippinensis]|uniref:MFS transporter n=1 Tax=Actinoplanes philippinensis TaxID=35752 RepID=UPI0033E6DC4C